MEPDGSRGKIIQAYLPWLAWVYFTDGDFHTGRKETTEISKKKQEEVPSP